MGIAELAFSLICFPYVARIIGPEKIGFLDFITVTVGYFIVFSSFGIPEFGMRQVSRDHGSRKLVEETLSSLWNLRIILTVALLGVYLISIYPLFGEFHIAYLLASVMLVSSTFNLVWALEGLEDFFYLAMARTLSKLGFAVFLFTVVKGPDDYLIYFVGNIAFDGIYYLASVLRLKLKFRFSFSVVKLLSSPILPTSFHRLSKVFALVVLQSSIMSVPQLIMGQFGDYKQLGFYSSALRFYWMAYYAIIPLSTVLLSRSTSMMNFTNTIQKKHFELTGTSIFSLALPLSFGLYAISDSLVILFLGEQYLESITLLRMLAPLLLTFSLSSFWTMQILFSFQGDKDLLKIFIIAFVCNIGLSMWGINRFGAMGACIAVNLTYCLVYVIARVRSLKFYQSSLFDLNFIKSLAACILMLVALRFFEAGNLFELLLKVGGGAVVYFTSIFAFRHSFVAGQLGKFK